MNRREALAALTGLPAVASIARAEVRPNDVIVIECEGAISQGTAARITAYVQSVWPHNKAIVLGDGLKLKVYRS